MRKANEYYENSLEVGQKRPGKQQKIVNAHIWVQFKQRVTDIDQYII